MTATLRLEAFLKGHLAAFNEAYLTGGLTTVEFLDLVSQHTLDVVEAVRAHGVGGLDVDARARVITALGFIIGSAEHHTRTDRVASTSWMRCFPGLESTLLELAGDDLPPRDTADTYWLANRATHGDDLLTYTADRGEVFFNDRVCRIDAALGRANRVLRDVIVRNHISPDDVDALRAVQADIRIYKATYAGFRASDDEGLPITPEFFALVFRTFLPEITIDGMTWSGPNAAFIGNVFSFDSLFGTATTWYQQHNRAKLPYLRATEAHVVERDLVGPSVLDVLAQALGLPAGLASVPPSDLAQRLADADPHVAAAASTIRDTWLELTKGTRGHEGLVRDFIDKPTAQLNEEERDRLAVSPDHGTGGGGRQLLADIGTMRKQCVPVSALRDALRLVSTDGGADRSSAA